MNILIAIFILFFISDSNASCRDFLDEVITVNSQKALEIDDDGEKFITYVSKFREKYGDISEVTNKLIKGGFDPKVKDIILDKYSLLLMDRAITLDHLDKVEKLLDFGVKLSASSDFHPDPIVIAAFDLNQPVLELFRLRGGVEFYPRIDSSIKYANCMKDKLKEDC